MNYQNSNNQQTGSNQVNNLLDDLINDPNFNFNPKDILGLVYDKLMKAERSLHNQQFNDHSNGFYDRTIGTPYGRIDLNVPRSRSSVNKFRPQILPDNYQRNQDEVTNILQSLFYNGYSPNQIKNTLHQLGLTYSLDDIEKIAANYLTEFDAWNNRPLKSDYAAIFIDAYNAETLLTNNNLCSVKNLAVFTVIAIDFEAKKDIIAAFFVEHNENKDAWMTLLNKLIARGLRKPLYIVTDDFPGLKDAIATLFPLSFHQLCIVHAKRNFTKNLAPNDAKNLKETFYNIQVQNIPFNLAKQQLNDQLLTLKNKYPHFVDYSLNRLDNYLAFIHLPKPIRKYFYSSNCVESFNSILEFNRRKSGNFFQSNDTLKIKFFISYKKLSEIWKNGVPLIKNNLYELSQLFATIFKHQPSSNTQLFV